MGEFRSPREITPKDIERFWAKVERSSPDDCWEWRGAHNGRYGMFKIGHEIFHAHRIAYRIQHGVCSSKVICHRCDNPRCVNPAHLWAGTQSENLKDAVRKGRVVPPPPRDHYPVKGEEHGQAKLTSADVIEIRRLLDRGNLTQAELGKRYGVSASTISMIKLRKKWKHI